MSVDLESIIIARNAESRGPRCTVITALEAVGEDERATLERFMRDPNFKHTAIVAGFKALGHPISTNALSRHRKGECSCGRVAEAIGSPRRTRTR